MAMLPSEFSELEPYAERWCLATERERWEERLASTIEEMQEFYDASFPRIEEAIAFCDKFDLHELPPDALNLLHLVFSFIMVSFPVELWRRPRVPSTGVTEFHRIGEPTP